MLNGANGLCWENGRLKFPECKWFYWMLFNSLWKNRKHHFEYVDFGREDWPINVSSLNKVLLLLLLLFMFHFAYECLFKIDKLNNMMYLWCLSSYTIKIFFKYLPLTRIICKKGKNDADISIIYLQLTILWDLKIT